jgi:hypothetical protein
MSKACLEGVAAVARRHPNDTVIEETTARCAAPFTTVYIHAVLICRPVTTMANYLCCVGEG